MMMSEEIQTINLRDGHPVASSLTTLPSPPSMSDMVFRAPIPDKALQNIVKLF